MEHKEEEQKKLSPAEARGYMIGILIGLLLKLMFCVTLTGVALFVCIHVLYFLYQHLPF